MRQKHKQKKNHAPVERNQEKQVKLLKLKESVKLVLKQNQAKLQTQHRQCQKAAIG